MSEDDESENRFDVTAEDDESENRFDVTAEDDESENRFDATAGNVAAATAKAVLTALIMWGLATALSVEILPVDFVVVIGVYLIFDLIVLRVPRVL